MPNRAARVVLLSSVLSAVAACSDCENPPTEDAGPIDVPDGGAPRGEVALNELMASNRTTIADQAGDYADWVELYNRGDADQSLAGWSLSDAATNLRRFAFPQDAVVPAGGFLLVWCDAEPLEADDEPHAPFRLNAQGEELFLVDPDGVVQDYVAWGPQNIDVSWGRAPDFDGPFASLDPPTPRERNAEPFDAGPPPVEDAGSAVDAGCAVDVRFSEVLVDNATTWPDQFGSHEPWIEVVNAGDDVVRTITVAVTDDPLAPRKAPLPNVLLPVADVLVVWADGDVESAPSHVALVVDEQTDALYLYDACLQLLDVIDLPDAPTADVSVGPDGDGGVVTYAAPTPGDPDNGPVAGDAGLVDAG